MNTNININEFKNQFVNWYNNNAYGYISDFKTFEECHDDIYDDDYEDVINDFSNYYGYDSSDVFHFIAHDIMNIY